MFPTQHFFWFTFSKFSVRFGVFEAKKKKFLMIYKEFGQVLSKLNANKMWEAGTSGKNTFLFDPPPPPPSKYIKAIITKS